MKEGRWRKYDLRRPGREIIAVPILKPENLGPEMAVDEKMIGEEMYTVLSNRENGKIALLTETMQVQDLLEITRNFGRDAEHVKNITCDLSPAYETYAEQAFTKAKRTADKFHVIRHIVDSLQAIRIRFRQQELSKLSKDKNAKEPLLENGETRRELLARSRYLLFKFSTQWTHSQRKRASVLFKYYPVLQIAQQLIERLRIWYDKKNIGKSFDIAQTQLYEWCEDAEDEKIPELNSLVRLLMTYETKILMYFETGKTNALAEAINSKIQRFITANYGVRDKDFFLYRMEKYFS